MHTLTNLWTEELENMKMEINREKTKVMRKAGVIKSNEVKRNENKLEMVTTYEYI